MMQQPEPGMLLARHLNWKSWDPANTGSQETTGLRQHGPASEKKTPKKCMQTNSFNKWNFCRASSINNVQRLNGEI